VCQESIFRFEVRFAGLLFQSFQLDLDPFQVSSSDMAVVFSLFRVIGNDKPPSACTLANEDLFDREILFDDLKPAAPMMIKCFRGMDNDCVISEIMRAFF